MRNRQDRLHELCVQVRSESDLLRLYNAVTEINDILASILSEVTQALHSRNLRLETLPGHGLVDLTDHDADDPHRKAVVVPFPVTGVETTRHHKVAFYSDDLQLLADVTRFVGAALKGRNSAIVVATESHRNSLLPRLRAHGLDIGTALQEGRYIAVDAAETLSTFVVNGVPDPARFMEACGALILTAAKAAQGQHPRVAVFAEDLHVLWERGNLKAVIQVEQLCNRLAELHDVDILCGYSLGSGRGGMDNLFFERICAEHSAVYSH
jgi:hypothetical protein